MRVMILAIVAMLALVVAGFGRYAFAQEEPKGAIKLTVEGIKLQQGGDLICALYNSKDTWLKQKKILTARSVPVTAETLEIVFTDMPFGDGYALFVFHDKNNNQKLDFRTFIFPIPKEGLGVSNNHIRKGPPVYEKAKFALSTAETSLKIKMHYE